MLTRSMTIALLALPWSTLLAEMPAAMNDVDWESALGDGPFTWGDTDHVLVGNGEFEAWMVEIMNAHGLDRDFPAIVTFMDQLHSLLHSTPDGIYIDIAR